MYAIKHHWYGLLNVYNTQNVDIITTLTAASAGESELV